MDDNEKIVAALKVALLDRLGDEVELIFRYGSHVHGATHPYSDVDLSYVPAHETTWDSITVMVNDTLFDLYPMHWSHLGRMAEFRDASSSVLLHHRIIYQRDDAAAVRMAGLVAQLQTRLQPAARPEMVRLALEIFHGTGYDYYLLRTQATGGYRLGCLRHAQAILQTVLHCLAVCNQACIDTRKLDQVLALPRMPAGFAAAARRVIDALEPAELLAATQTLLDMTRALLLTEQRQWLRHNTTFPATFDDGYPELKRDLQGIMLACERQDLFALKTSLVSLLHEMSRGVAQVTTGVTSADFNTLADYEQDLVALGFPALLPAVVARDFTTLHQLCLLFDQRLRAFLAERDVRLNTFDTPDELQTFLVSHATASN